MRRTVQAKLATLLSPGSFEDEQIPQIAGEDYVGEFPSGISFPVEEICYIPRFKLSRNGQYLVFPFLHLKQF